MAEEIYNLKYSGEETDEILESAKNVKEANLTTLNDISGFVCINKEGNAIGMMSKEQVAQVVGGLLGTDKCIKIKETLYNGDANDIRGSIYEVNGLLNTPKTQGILETVFTSTNIGLQKFYYGTPDLYIRIYWYTNGWTKWKKITLLDID